MPHRQPARRVSRRAPERHGLVGRRTGLALMLGGPTALTAAVLWIAVVPSWRHEASPTVTVATPAPASPSPRHAVSSAEPTRHADPDAVAQARLDHTIEEHGAAPGDLAADPRSLGGSAVETLESNTAPGPVAGDSATGPEPTPVRFVDRVTFRDLPSTGTAPDASPTPPASPGGATGSVTTMGKATGGGGGGGSSVRLGALGGGGGGGGGGNAAALSGDDAPQADAGTNGGGAPPDTDAAAPGAADAQSDDAAMIAALPADPELAPSPIAAVPNAIATPGPSALDALTTDDSVSSDLDDAVKRRLVLWLNVGWSARNPATHHVGRGLPQTGWASFVQREIVPHLDWGVRRVMLHNPFGINPEENPMSFNQYLEARDAGLHWLTDGFVEAWRPVIEGRYTDGEPVEVIGYLGALRRDDDFAPLVEAGDLATWEARVDASIAPLVEAGMSIGFDAMSPTARDHPAFAKLTALQEGGVPIYIETWPALGKEHWADFGILCLEAFALRGVKPHAARYVPKTEFRHGLLRLLNNHSRDRYPWLADEVWFTVAAHRILAEGDILATSFQHFIDEGVSPQQLLRDAETYGTANYD